MRVRARPGEGCGRAYHPFLERRLGRDRAHETHRQRAIRSENPTAENPCTVGRIFKTRPQSNRESRMAEGILLDWRFTIAKVAHRSFRPTRLRFHRWGNGGTSTTQRVSAISTYRLCHAAKQARPRWHKSTFAVPSLWTHRAPHRRHGRKKGQCS